jgi:hypothetical protein
LGNSFHNGLSANGDGLVARVRASEHGVIRKSIRVYPLAQASHAPRPVSAGHLVEQGAILRTSSAAIARHQAPAPLRRLAFALMPTQSPAPGFRLVFGKDVPPLVGIHTKVGRPGAPRRTPVLMGWTPPPARPPARWILPKSSP